MDKRHETYEAVNLRLRPDTAEMMRDTLNVFKLLRRSDITIDDMFRHILTEGIKLSDPDVIEVRAIAQAKRADK